MIPEIPETFLERAAREQLRQQEALCYHDIAAAIRNHFPGIEITGPMVAGRVNELLRAEAMLKHGDCGTCARERFCQYSQGTRNVVRINCPVWRARI